MLPKIFTPLKYWKKKFSRKKNARNKSKLLCGWDKHQSMHMPNKKKAETCREKQTLMAFVRRGIQVLDILWQVWRGDGAGESADMQDNSFQLPSPSKRWQLGKHPESLPWFPTKVGCVCVKISAGRCTSFVFKWRQPPCLWEGSFLSLKLSTMMLNQHLTHTHTLTL